MYLLRNNMIRVSGPVHGASPPFKHDAIGLSTIKGNSQQNGKYRKQVFKCNGQVDIQSNTSPMRSHNAQKIRFSPNPKSSIVQRHSPFKEMQFHISKSEIEQADLFEPILFAGSKSCVTPSPSELPKPPQNWMNLSSSKLLVSLKTEVVPLDLTHDSAVLAVGTEKEHLLKLKSILK